jgi:hypothetical protein
VQVGIAGVVVRVAWADLSDGARPAHCAGIIREVARLLEAQKKRLGHGACLTFNGRREITGASVLPWTQRLKAVSIMASN